MNAFFMGVLRQHLAASPDWQRFENTRRARTLVALVELLRAAGAVRNETFDAHFDAVLEAAFPLEVLADLLGVDGLQALQQALSKGRRT